MGAILFMGIYHLTLNLYRRKDKLALYFSIVCFLTVMRSVSVGEYILVEYLNWNWQIVTRIEFISFYLLVGFTSMFIYALFPKIIPKIATTIPLGFTLVSSLITLVFPIYYTSYLIPVGQLLTVLMGIIFIFLLAKNSIKGGAEIRVALVGLIILFMAAVFEILTSRATVRVDVVFATGMFLYLFSHVAIMANRTNANYKKTAQLSLAMKALNADLELKVQERTQQLDEQNIELRKANENLTAINNEKDGILHVVAHDLKSALNTNIGLVSLLKASDEMHSAENLKYFDLINHVTKQALKFIDDLLLLYQFDGTYKPELSKIKLLNFVNELKEKFEQTALKKNIAFTVEHNLEASAEQVFYSDESMLGRITENLLSNAFKYSLAETKVTLKLSLSEGKLVLIVADQGQGIPEEEHDKVFKKFQRISVKPTANETSSGLGLSIVKQLVTILGGKISFKSVVNKGTSFSVEIPNAK